jgi:hypothetical protein
MRLLLLCLTTLVFAASVRAADPPKIEIRNVYWQRIDYPRFLIPGESDKKMEVMVRSGASGERYDRSELQLYVTWTGPLAGPTPAALAHPERVTARLHLPEEVIPPRAVPFKEWAGAGSNSGCTWSRLFVFPWARNRLDEGWIELNVGNDQRYWLEIPYGFVRNPTDPAPSRETNRGMPQIAPAMKEMAETDRIVPWSQVEFQLGDIPDHYKLMVNLANPFRPAAEVRLYNDPGERALTLDSPRTGISFVLPDGEEVEGAKIAVRHDNPSLERVDTFRLGCGNGSDNEREWATAVAIVDGRRYGFGIPSSLYKYVHGSADHSNKQRLPMTRDVFGPEIFHLLLRDAD